jgi:hypothetical protein
MSMDVNDLMKKAWQSVEQAGIPEALQADAFKEAVAYLRGGDPKNPPQGKGNGEGRASASKGKQRSTRKADGPSATPPQDLPAENEFFEHLAAESGVEENRLRDCLQLTDAGSVHITPPTRQLGSSKTAQAQAVVALVAGARSRGLGENPVDAEAVHEELKRKHCWDANNFANKHLGPMKGFNAGSNRSQIVLTSKWDQEFDEAIAKALNDAPEEK